MHENAEIEFTSANNKEQSNSIINIITKYMFSTYLNHINPISFK